MDWYSMYGKKSNTSIYRNHSSIIFFRGALGECGFGDIGAGQGSYIIDVVIGDAIAYCVCGNCTLACCATVVASFLKVTASGYILYYYILCDAYCCVMCIKIWGASHSRYVDTQTFAGEIFLKSCAIRGVCSDDDFDFDFVCKDILQGIHPSLLLHFTTWCGLKR